MNIPYLGDNSVVFPPYPLILDLRIKQFNQIITSLVKKYPFNYIDLYDQTKLASREKSYYSADGFHPSDKGYMTWGNIINANLSK
jgi:lysophospholipase L1-like esterase